MDCYALPAFLSCPWAYDIQYVVAYFAYFANLAPPPPHHEPNISLFGFTVVETPSKATGKLSRTRLTWIREHMQHCPGKYDQSIIFKELRNSLTFRFREHSQNIIGNRGDFENFSWEHGNTDPLRGLWV